MGDFKSTCDLISPVFSNDFLQQSLQVTQEIYNSNSSQRLKWLADINKRQLTLNGKRNILLQIKEVKTIKEAIIEKSRADHERIESLLIEIDTLSKKINQEQLFIDSEEAKSPINYYIEIHGQALIDHLLEKRKWIEEALTAINNNASAAKLKSVVSECDRILIAAAILFANPKFFSCIGRNSKEKIRSNLENTRVTLPIQKIFETDMNIIVLGEAGAGKSTSVQMYAISNKDNAERLIIFIPLSNFTMFWNRLETEISHDQRIVNFDEALAKYLAHKDIAITPDQFKNEISGRRSVFLLDGLDEAIKSNRWLPAAINQFAVKYKKAQVIVTSRLSGNYLEEISFFPVTILPFTEGQRDDFVQKWFKGGNENYYEKVIAHLRKNPFIDESTKTPLLATTLCVLADNGIELPDTESKLYNERLRLMMGYYDRVKGIESRITSNTQNLEIIAQKLAYYLHSKGKREEEQQVLEVKATGFSFGYMSESEAIVCLQELIDPCNILIPMTDDGKFGFGHLRYQEHLVAKELMSNRNIDIINLIKVEWWAGPLVLFARMNANLKWLVNCIFADKASDYREKTLALMIAVRPAKEQDELNAIIRKHAEFNSEFPLP